MASVIDTQHFREHRDTLNALHDEWMHNSTRTNSDPQGNYVHDTNPPGYNIQDFYYMVNNLPSGTNTATLGYSQADVANVLKKHTHYDSPAAATGHPANGGTTTGNGSGDNDVPNQRRLWFRRGERAGWGRGGYRGRSRGGRGGGRAQGSTSLGKTPTLGNVPYSPTGTGPSPMLLILLLGGGGLLIWYIWKKTHKPKHEEKETEKKEA